MEILPKIYLAANKINYLDYPFYNYEIRKNSIMTSQNNKIKFNSIIFIYNSWKKQFDEIQNYNMKKKLYGVLIKHYLYSCRELKITKWLIPGIDAFFSLHYALNMKEKIKVIAFAMLPDLYIKI